MDTLLAELKQKESMGYEYSVADASFELILQQALGKNVNYFNFKNFF